MKRLQRTPRAPGAPKASDGWRTPRALFLALHAEFNFQIDLAASPQDRLLDRWLGPGGLAPDALAAPWTHFARRGFLNPPYSSALIRVFLEKAATEAARGFTSVCLTPYTPDTQWWQSTAAAVEIREIPHRVPYLRADGVTKAGAMFPSAIIVFRPQPGLVRGDPRRVVWTYRDQVLPQVEPALLSAQAAAREARQHLVREMIR
jgi:DNA (cytosine-5)-methyltransferase 1